MCVCVCLLFYIHLLKLYVYTVNADAFVCMFVSCNVTLFLFFFLVWRPLLPAERRPRRPPKGNFSAVITEVLPLCNFRFLSIVALNTLASPAAFSGEHHPHHPPQHQRQSHGHNSINITHHHRCHRHRHRHCHRHRHRHHKRSGSRTLPTVHYPKRSWTELSGHD